ncbi:OsmC family peroxiredoxin [Roseomonas frigidaquae]|uniref:OsmC family peroxiredoxin n=1 Tax=Falsiroseomonas frigidaquae TaxID=487318 RepID=A0ABX1F430_9PROT|nr:OsmC family peroxiredoxin [Falsiroseomonas frigidaquae]NKE47117.1 OsmC family peroxiredoxin [Falsiroseomonas frigidaquae]
MRTFATAVWRGGIENGMGSLSMRSGAMVNHPFSAASRDRRGLRTNPEELLAAAHASSFSLTLAALLDDAGFVAARMDTSVEVTLAPASGSFTITALRLTLEARVPHLQDAAFQALASRAQAACPVARLCRVETSLEATLLG